jgi:uncharacterized cofD-like protein
MKVVSIGGGTGLAVLLRGLKAHVVAFPSHRPIEPPISRLTAVVTVADEGGSSGRLRREFGVLPPGDVRNCLVALAEDEQILTQIFEYRFSRGLGLRGHSLGNLFLTALTDLTGDFAQAVRSASEILAVRGEIFPATLQDVRLRALLANGRVVNGEAGISQAGSPIRRLSIVPEDCKPVAETLKAIESADLITVGPGSLYTSLIPNLLVRGIAEKIEQSSARKVYIANLMTQPGETTGYTAAAHLRALMEHAGRNLFNRALLNTRPLSPELLRTYRKQGAEPVACDVEAIRSLGIEPLCAPLLEEEDWVARHEPRLLANEVLRLASQLR